jgi:5'-methylthioinosine phosphorylase
MSDLAIIGGTGLTSLESLEITRREVVHTPYGEASGPLTYGKLRDKEVVFLARHGYGHTIPPHQINFRANIWAMQHIGVQKVIAIAAVGGIREDLTAGRLAFPDQIIDYTWSRGHTFYEDSLEYVTHIDFTWPYCEELRQLLIQASDAARLDAVDGGTYGATQGPRLETAAEINRLEVDGCDMVGMTGMPEAALARELGLCYATCALVANRAAGRGEGTIDIAQIDRTVREGVKKVGLLLEHVIPLL